MVSFHAFVANNADNINSGKEIRDNIVNTALVDIANGLVDDGDIRGLLSGYYAQFMIKPFMGMRCGLFMDAKKFIAIMSKNLETIGKKKSVDKLHDSLIKFGDAVLETNHPRWIEL